MFFPFCSRHLDSIILKKVGKIGGDDGRVRQRLKLILSRIDPNVEFSISDVKVRGSGGLPPIYEVVLTETEAAVQLRESFKRFTRKRKPVDRPPELDGVEIFNSVTLATRVRISILRVCSLFFFLLGFLCSTFFCLLFYLTHTFCDYI